MSDCHFYPAEKCPEIGVDCRANNYCPRQHAIFIAECTCAQKTCTPECNEGRRCWRSGFLVPEGYFGSSDQPDAPRNG